MQITIITEIAEYDQTFEMRNPYALAFISYPIYVCFCVYMHATIYCIRRQLLMLSELILE